MNADEITVFLWDVLDDWMNGSPYVQQPLDQVAQVAQALDGLTLTRDDLADVARMMSSGYGAVLVRLLTEARGRRPGSV